jgi:polysaccharide pyruvyl transferase WcaK-like protein
VLFRSLGQEQARARSEFCYDVAFAVDPIEPPHLEVAGLSWNAEESDNLVGFNVSGLLLTGGYSRNNMFGLGLDYRSLVLSVIDSLITRKRARVLLVPHVFESNGNLESDVDSCEQIYESLRERYPGHLGIVSGSYDQSEIKYVIGRCDFFIGSRMHACIAAISQNVPAVCIAYSDKFIGVMETIGIQALVADAREASLDQILVLIEHTYDERNVFRAQIKQRMVDVKERVLAMLQDPPKSVTGIERGKSRRSESGRGW